LALAAICSLLGVHCGSSSSTGGTSRASGVGAGDSSATCLPYCTHAVQSCGIMLDGCLGACQTFLAGACSSQWKAVYECGAQTKLTCDANGANPYGCIGQLSMAGDCMFPANDAGHGD
jgi:hypothetical protein